MQIFLLLVAAIYVSMAAAYNPPPTILDTDYGSFIDDIFAVGLLLQSTDVLDPRLILTTAEEPEWSANCVSDQIARSDLGFEVPVAIGETLPPYSERGTVCGVPGLIGFALKDTCAEAHPDLPPPIPNGVAHAASMLMESERNDWTYIAVGGQTSLQKLVRDFPKALNKIETLVVMGGNFCTGFEAYPDVPTPTAETNIGCDMAAANFVLEAAARAHQQKKYFPAIHYVPIVTVNVLSGDDYSLILDAASNNTNHNNFYSKAAHATIDYYKAWSANARANKSLLIHKEAMTFDPAFESTPQFDAVAVLVAMDIARGSANKRVAQHEFANGVHFVTNQEAELAGKHPEFFKGKPAPAAYSLWTGNEVSLNDKITDNHPISGRCEGLTPYHFDATLSPPSTHFSQPLQPPPPPVAIQVALGFHSQESEKDFFHEMALRISGRFASVSTPQQLCGSPAAVENQTTKTMAMAAPVEVGHTTRRIEQNVSAAPTSSSSLPPPTTTTSTQSSLPKRLIAEECSATVA